MPHKLTKLAAIGSSLLASAALAAPSAMVGSGSNWGASAPAAESSWKLPTMPKLWGQKAPEPQLGFSQPFFNQPQPTVTQRATQALTDNRLTRAFKKDNPGPRLAPPDAISLSTPTGEVGPQLVLSMAQLAESRGETETARQHFKQAVARWSNEPSVLREAGHFEDRQSRFDDAAWLYKRAVELAPTNPAALNDLALCDARRGDLAAATNSLRQAIALRPDKALYRNNLAVVLIEQNEVQTAYEELLPVHGPAVAHYNVGQLLSQRSRHSEAAMHLQQAVAIDSSFTAARQALAALPQAAAPHVAAKPMQRTQSPVNVPITPVVTSEPDEPEFLKLLPPVSGK